MALFDTAPQKYLPPFGDDCANCIVYAIPWGGDADTWRIVDGKPHTIAGQASKDGGTRLWQRSKRLIFHVSYYKSRGELSKEAATAQAKKAQGG